MQLAGGLVIPGKGNDMHNRTSGMRSQTISQRWLLETFQQDEQFIYALITRENAVKIGVSVNLANRKSGIRFGGVDRFIGFMPGGFPEERRIHTSLAEFRIHGTREYYYPVPGVLPAINLMREWMGIRPWRRRELPRPASCTFHGRILRAEHGK